MSGLTTLVVSKPSFLCNLITARGTGKDQWHGAEVYSTCPFNAKVIFKNHAKGAGVWLFQVPKRILFIANVRSLNGEDQIWEIRETTEQKESSSTGKAVVRWKGSGIVFFTAKNRVNFHHINYETGDFMVSIIPISLVEV